MEVISDLMLVDILLQELASKVRLKTAMIDLAKSSQRGSRETCSLRFY